MLHERQMNQLLIFVIFSSKRKKLGGKRKISNMNNCNCSKLESLHNTIMTSDLYKCFVCFPGVWADSGVDPPLLWEGWAEVRACGTLDISSLPLLWSYMWALQTRATNLAIVRFTVITWSSATLAMRRDTSLCAATIWMRSPAKGGPTKSPPGLNVSALLLFGVG